jgi:hypothetical protein
VQPSRRRSRYGRFFEATGKRAVTARVENTTSLQSPCQTISVAEYQPRASC